MFRYNDHMLYPLNNILNFHFLTILPPDQAGGWETAGLTPHSDGVSFSHSQSSQLLGAKDTGSNCNDTVKPEEGARISLKIF